MLGTQFRAQKKAREILSLLLLKPWSDDSQQAVKRSPEMFHNMVKSAVYTHHLWEAKTFISDFS